jgi:hypothetical protein
VYDEREVEHRDEMPLQERAGELDPATLEELVNADLPVDEPVPEESKGA